MKNLSLQKRLLEHRETVLQAVEVGATLDCLIALYVENGKYIDILSQFTSRPSLPLGPSKVCGRAENFH